MKAKPIPDSIRSCLRYDPETGLFTWTRDMSRKTKAGMVAGCRLSDGYIQITYNRKRYMAHRIAWFLSSGEEPGTIDHINHDPSDNRLCNLRNVDHSTNNVNRRYTTGIHWKWHSSTNQRGRKYRWRIVVASYKKRQLYAGSSILKAWHARIMAERADHPIGLPSP